MSGGLLCVEAIRTQTMKRPNSPHRQSNSILVYGFGLALVLSLVFNGFLLYENSHQRRLTEYDLGNPVHPVEQVVWLQQLSDCTRANQQKNSLIGGPTHSPIRAGYQPPGRAATVHHASSK